MIHWYRGELGEGEVRLSVDSQAFRFGAGVFETICYNGRDLCRFTQHLERMGDSLHALGMPALAVDDAGLAQAAMEVVRQNRLADSWARVNIYCLQDGDLVHPLVVARAHEPKPKKTYRLAVCPEHHLSPLAGHKTMNYLFYERARVQAVAAGSDGAALTDADDLLVEANSSALVFSRHGRFTVPRSRFALPSTALNAAQELLQPDRRPVSVGELDRFDHAYLLNSMIGMRPVTGIGEVEFAADEAGCGAPTAAILCLEG